MVDDIWLRFNRLDPEDQPKVIDDCECVNYPANLDLPQARLIVLDLMRLVEGERLGRVIVTRLPPGGVITPHKDQGAPAAYYDRYQLAVQALPGNVFRAGEEQITMASGDIWWFDNEQEHEVKNNSEGDRIVVIIDIRTSRNWES
jgi:hypothetical protein